MKHALTVSLQSAPESRMTERPDLAGSFQEINQLMGFDTIMATVQRFLTASQREAKYGAAR